MTAPGGGILKVNPDEHHMNAQGLRTLAAEIHAGLDSVDTSWGPWATPAIVGALNMAFGLHLSAHQMAAYLEGLADHQDRSAAMVANQESENSQKLQGVAPNGGKAAMDLGKGAVDMMAAAGKGAMDLGKGAVDMMAAAGKGFGDTATSFAGLADPIAKAAGEHNPVDAHGLHDPAHAEGPQNHPADAQGQQDPKHLPKPHVAQNGISDQGVADNTVEAQPQGEYHDKDRERAGK